MKKSSAKKKCLKESTDKTKKKLSFENVEEIKNKIPIPESYPKSPSPISEINPPKETNEQKLEKIFKEGDKVSKYDFDLHKHLKENIKFKDKQCKDGLSTETLYCLQCKLSTCSKCPNFNIHKDHPLVKKSPYYICEENLINEHFDEINLIIELNPEFLNTKKVKEELKNLVNNNIEVLQNKLIEVKKSKLKEIEQIFEKSENCVEILTQKVKKLKKDLKVFVDKQKKFFCIDVSNNAALENLKKNNPEANEVITNLKEGSKTNFGMITTNKDNLNSTFLIIYDLLKNTKNINDHIRYFINDIRINREKFINDFTKQKELIYEELNKLQSYFNGTMNYQYLTSEFYKIIYDKMSKYEDQIENMKRKIMDKVNKKGTLEEVEKDNKISGTHINLKFEHILNNQIIDGDEAKTILTKSKKTIKKSHFNSGQKSFKHGPITTNGEKVDSLPEKLYNNCNEVKLDKAALQDFFAYEALNVVDKNFRIKKKKKNDEFEVDFDEDIDVAKPIPGKTEIMVYDRKSMNMVKKTIKFDKAKHKYLNFLNGCRSVLIKDRLYIFGGVDKENNVTNVAWVYYIKENELKPMHDMLNPHAYHGVQFLDYYKSIVVVGGENCSSCELYDMKTGQWRNLPNLGIPRANCTLYLDKMTHRLYAFFGILGKIAERNNNYSDALECLEFRKLALGWCRVDYNNRAEISFRTGINQILPLNPEMLLVYGGSSMREFIKKAAIFVLSRLEMIKIDNRTFNEIREISKKSKKLSKILSTVD
jgi:hypothetical protein